MFLLVSSCLVFANNSKQKAALTAQVKLDSGIIVGKAENGVKKYLGIPYAAPPVGKLRWQEPQVVQSWKGVKNSINFGSACPQSYVYAGKTSEDCLYLNVWTPDYYFDSDLPVMVWIHGGAFLQGAGSIPLYDGTRLAQKGVIVVTVNYRLGALGFFAHPLLIKESPHHSAGDYGMLDQIAALKWVQRNIAAFGGDPRKVTVFGESAGGESVNLLMVSPLAKDLFQRAIVESGPIAGGTRFLHKEVNDIMPAEEVGKVVSKNLNCSKAKDELQCLRAKTPKEIENAAYKDQKKLQVEMANVIFAPVVEGYFLPDSPVKLWEGGKQYPLPMIIGTNADEATLFLKMCFAAITTPQLYREYVEKTFGDEADQVLKMFPVKKSSDIFMQLNKLITLKWFKASALLVVNSMAKKKVPVWLYKFDHKPTAAIFKLVYPDQADSSIKKMGAAHGIELPYVFGNFKVTEGHKVDRYLSKLMLDYWTHFAKKGNPDRLLQIYWPSYNKHKQYFIFGDKTTIKKVTVQEKKEYQLMKNMWDLV
jgi:para-nitrobenzyl esterase